MHAIEGAPVPEVSVQIQRRVNVEKHPFSEVLYTVVEDDGRTTYAATRYWWTVDDTPMQRTYEAQAFLTRRKRFA